MKNFIKTQMKSKKGDKSENVSMNLGVLNFQGLKTTEITLPSEIFDCEMNHILLKEVIEYQMSNARQATYGTCRRKDLSYSTIKLANQKGRGKARIGQRGAPHHRHGSVAFGPDGRIYEYTIPKQKRKKALCICLSQKLRDGDFILLEDFNLPEIKTKNFIETCQKLNLPRKTLFIDVENDQKFYLSMRNVVGYNFLKLDGINPVSILKADKVVMTLNSLKKLEEKYENF